MGNLGEQPPRYDLEKARAEADEMKKMITEGKAENYKEAGEKIEKEITSIEQLKEEENKFLKRVDELEAEGLDGRKLNTSEFWDKLGDILNKTKENTKEYFVGESGIYNMKSYFNEIFIRFLASEAENRGLLPKNNLEDLRESLYEYYYLNLKNSTKEVNKDIQKICLEKSENIVSSTKDINKLKELVNNAFLILGAIGWGAFNTPQKYNAYDIRQKEILEYFKIDSKTLSAYRSADKKDGFYIGHIFNKMTGDIPVSLFSLCRKISSKTDDSILWGI